MTRNGTVEVPLGRNAKYGTLSVDLSRLNESVMDYVFDYGLRQVLNDAMAIKTDDDGNALSVKAIVAKAERRLANLYDGTIRARGMGDADPVEAEFHKLVRHHVTAIFRHAGKLKGVPKGTKDQLMFAINRDRAKLGKPELTFAEYAAAYAQGEHGKKLMRDAARVLKERAEINVDELINLYL